MFVNYFFFLTDTGIKFLKQSLNLPRHNYCTELFVRSDMKKVTLGNTTQLFAYLTSVSIDLLGDTVAIRHWYQL